MADNIIETIIRAKDEASKAFLAAANNADKLASEQAAAVKSGDALDQQAADTAAALERQAQASEEAARAAAALARAPDATPGGDTRTPKSLNDTAGAADNAAKSVSNLSGRVMTLRYNLMDVGQQLAGGANPFMVLMQQGPEIAGALGDASEAAEVLKGAFGGIISTLAPAATMLAGVAVAAAALGTAMIVLKNATEEADEAGGRLSARMGETAARAAKLQEGFAAAAMAVGELRRETADAELGLLELTGQIDRFTAAATRQKKALQENTAATVLTLSNIEQAARAEREAAEANLRNTSILTGMTAAQIEAAGAAVESARAREAAAKAAREEAERERDRQAEIIDLEAEYQIEAEASNEVLKQREERSRAAAKAAEERAKAEREAAAASAQWAKEQGMINAAAQGLAGLIADLEALPQIIQDGADAALIKGASEGLAGLAKDLEGLARTFGAMIAQQIQRGARIGASVGEVLGGDIAGGLAKALPMLGAKFAEAFAGQDGLLGKIAAVAGPIGAAVGAAISGLQTLGQQGGAATARSAMGQVDAITQGIKNIPAFLRKFIPEFIVALITEMIPALIAAVPQMIVNALVEVPVAIVRGLVLWWRDIGGFRGIARSIADGVREWWRETWDRIRTWFRDIFTPGDQSRGRRVSDTRAQEIRDFEQMATDYLSPNPNPYASAAEAQRANRSRRAATAGPTLVVQAASLHPDVVPRAMRDMDRLLRPGGLRRGTTVLGGT